MERAFIISKDSEYHKIMDEYDCNAEIKRVFVKDFLESHEIEASSFYMGGNGVVGRLFREYQKSDIYLYIKPTENDVNKFGKSLLKEVDGGLRRFRKGSKILKEFQQTCIDNKIIINLYSPDERDYFKSLGYAGYRRSLFEYDGKTFIKISSDSLGKDDTPEGFTEIPLSEFYKFYELKEQG